MICVFAAFVLGDLRVLRVIGLGMAVAVLLDALVRMVATPAVLQLIGRANWWFPRRLDRAVPNILSEVKPPGQQGPATAAASCAQLPGIAS
jgi:putative drug exporter of the RND superfamily